MNARVPLAIAAAASLLACRARDVPVPGATPAAHPTGEDRTGSVLAGGRPQAPSPSIRVEEVRVVQEAGHAVILDVTYTYDAPPPASEVKLLALADMPYWASTEVVVAPGRNVARLTLSLHEKKLREDGRDSCESSQLTLSFRHYAPGGYRGPLLDEVIPLRKVWRVRG